MERCFVIQPFDNDKFDRRYVDIFQPAIQKADLEAYRIDKDLKVRIPIEEIERGISESLICFAEITTDNPNVWYELGYAFACNKDVVMVCSEERGGKFPFDIQHRHVITYKTGSKSDFETLEETITRKIKAYIQSRKTVKTLNVTPVVDTEGLKSHEIALLILIAENQLTDMDNVSVYNLKTEMGRAGYTDIATGVGIRALVRKDMIETTMDSDQWGNNYTVCRLTTQGENWILTNQEQLQFRKSVQQSKNDNTYDDLPFQCGVQKGSAQQCVCAIVGVQSNSQFVFQITFGYGGQ